MEEREVDSQITRRLSYLTAAGAAAACGLWLVVPEIGPLPLLLGLAPWLARWRVAGRPGVRTAFDLPMLIFFITAGVSVWAAYDRQAAVAKFWLLVGAALLFYAFANWLVDGGRDASRFQAWLLSLLAAATALLFLSTNDWAAAEAKSATLATLGRALQSVLPRLPFEGLHPNVAGGILAVLIPFSGATLYITWREGRRTAIALSFALCCLAVGGLLLTATRGAWLALIGAGLLVVWWPISGRITQHQRQRRNWYFAVPVLLLVGGLLALALIPGLAVSLVDALPPSDTGSRRAVLYANSLNLVSDYPVIGAGLGGYMMLYSTYSLLSHVGFITHSHNLYIDVLIEQGIIALLSLSFMWLLMFEAVWRSMALHRAGRGRRRRPAEEPAKPARQASDTTGKPDIQYWRVVLGAGAVSLGVMLLQGLVDDPIYGSRGIVLFFLPLAYAVPILRAVAVPSRIWQARTLAVTGGAIVLVGLIWWRPILSHIRSNLAAVEQSRLELSNYSWPEWPIQDAVRRQVDLSTVVQDYEGALALQADNASANRRLGQIELSLGQYDAALTHLREAYRATPWDNATRQLLGEAYIVTGDVAVGKELWESVDDRVGQLAIRRYWYDSLGEDPPLSWVREAQGG